MATYPPYKITFQGKGMPVDAAGKSVTLETPGPHTLVLATGGGAVTVNLSHHDENGDKTPTLIITFS